MTAMLYLHLIEPMHSGTGQSTDVVDLPVTRDLLTNWPDYHGSGLKGALRAQADALAASGVLDPAHVSATFGREGNEEQSSRAGGVVFADARMLCFPVRSLYGTFAWVTCPMALALWARDRELLFPALTPLALPEVPAGSALVCSQSSRLRGPDSTTVFLRDLDLEANGGTVEAVDAIAAHLARTLFGASASSPEPTGWALRFLERFLVVDDEVFTFLTETATDVVPRIRIEAETGTVARGAFWYEELVPHETIMVAPMPLTPNLRTPDDHPAGHIDGVIRPATRAAIRLGGDATVGRGLTRIVVES